MNKNGNCFRVLCETIKEFITKMAAMQTEAEQADGDSIAHKCRVLNDKLDLLLSALHQEAPPLDETDPEMSEQVHPFIQFITN